MWVETPSNPLWRVTDVAAVAALAHGAGAVCVCDNTSAPIIQRPLALGADLVVYATTKYLGGHGDVLGGAVVARTRDALFDRVRAIQGSGGAVPSPFDCWLVRRGIRTLPWRMRAHSDNALKVATFLATHPRVEAVHYPGLASHPQHDVARRQMTGFGGMLSMQVRGGRVGGLRGRAQGADLHVRHQLRRHREPARAPRLGGGRGHPLARQSPAAVDRARARRRSDRGSRPGAGIAAMAELVIEGGTPLRGTLTPSGNKNAAFPLIAAALLTDQPVTLRNLPDISDVRTMLEAMEGLGVEVGRHDRHTVTLRAAALRSTAPDPVLLRRIRGALVLLGPLLARERQVRFGTSGGDQIGRRRIDSHVLGLQALGAVVEQTPDLVLRAERLRGADILLDEASVTATENVLAAAVLAEGTTIIRNAASEPHVQDQCRLLVQMGARIEGIGSNVLVVHGGRRLGGADFTLGADFMEVGSFIALAAATGGEIEIRAAGVEHMRMSLLVFRRLGIEVRVRGDDLVVPGGQTLAIAPDFGNAIPRIDDGPWPAFPADLMSVALVTATQAAGTVLFHEKMYESRLFFVDRLIGMGARVVLCDPHRVLVHGPARLRGEPQGLPSPDIRAGIALVIAALCADGTTVIRSVEQIDRGYEDIDAKLLALGARVTRIPT